MAFLTELTELTELGFGVFPLCSLCSLCPRWLICLFLWFVSKGLRVLSFSVYSPCLCGSVREEVLSL